MPEPRKPVLSMERTKGFTDGVLAVVITLLVLGLEVPEDHDFNEAGLYAFLLKVWRQFHPYVASFALISAYWVQHTVIFHYIERGRRTLVWLNLLLLLAISPLPFLTDLRATYPREPVVAAIFGAAQVCCGLLLFALWHFGTRVRPGRTVDPKTYRSMRLRILLGPVLVILASFAALVDNRLATAVFVAMPLLYVSHRRVDEDWQESDETTPPALAGGPLPGNE